MRKKDRAVYCARQTVLYAVRTAALLVVLLTQQCDSWAGEGRPTHCGWPHTAIDIARPLSIWRHATVWTSPCWDRISCDRLHGSMDARFAEFRDVRTSALPILGRKIFCQVKLFSSISCCVLGQYSLKAAALFGNCLSSKIALAVPNNKKMCLNGMYCYYVQ